MGAVTPLCALADKYQTDKGCYGASHCYTPIYYDLFQGRNIKRVLEIGILNGASLRMWEEFFPNAAIFGIDHNNDTLINEDRIRSFQCDQGDRVTLTETATKAGGNFDLIVDDGSHQLIHQVLSAQVLLPFLASFGLYVIEDVEQPDVIRDKFAAYHPEVLRTGEGHNDMLVIMEAGS